MLINSVALVRLTHDNAGGRHLGQGIMMSSHLVRVKFEKCLNVRN